MAKVSPINSDIESPNGTTSSVKANSKTKKDTSPMEVDGEEEGGEEGGEEESEYEIEAILDAKRGSFPEGRMGYFVKWKGYPNSENSWVDEQDAGNADDLIAQYWKTHAKSKKAPRKSVDAKTPKRGRKSAAPEDSSDQESSVIKKRGRKSQVKPDSDAENGNDADETRVTKKPKKGSAKEPTETSPTEVSEIGDMKQYMKVASWEKLITSVDTIEREEDGTLTVYFVLTTGERVKEKSTLCRQRFPQRLLDFFESNLRWRVADESEAGDN